MRFILAPFGILFSFLLIKNREMIGDSLGEGDWMRSFGGVYMLVIYVALFIFFWSVAELTGTMDFFIAPVRFLIPGMQNAAPTGI